jgi:hypothetical protein
MSGWWEFVIIPFVVVPLLTAFIEVLARRESIPETEDCAIGFDLLLAVAVSSLSLWAATGPQGVAQKTSYENLLMAIPVWALVAALLVKRYGWRPSYPAHYEITWAGVLIPLVFAAFAIGHFCRILEGLP